MLKVICVLKSGGDYDASYVDALRSSVEKHLTVPYLFVCLSDIPVPDGYVRLNNDYKGWWSKIEIFRLKGSVLYLDLDTIILDNINSLAGAILALPKNQFLMLKAIHRARQWASGIMGWSGDFRWIYDQFKYSRYSRCNPRHWDQDYIIAKLLAENMQIKYVQDYQPGIYSYKKHCKEKGQPPDDAKIILFHGKPRPHDCNEEWVKENWQ